MTIFALVLDGVAAQVNVAVAGDLDHTLALCRREVKVESLVIRLST